MNADSWIPSEEGKEMTIPYPPSRHESYHSSYHRKSSKSEHSNTGSVEFPSRGILWSCICRDNVILAEAGEDVTDEEIITRTAKELLRKPPTPGWEYHNRNVRRPRSLKLRGLKFHVYDQDDITGKIIIWKFCAIHDHTIARDQAHSFIEKLVGITEILRLEDYDRWRNGDTLAAQETFAPTLLQRMQEVAYKGRLAMVNRQVDTVKEHMHKNIELMLENTERAQDLKQEANRLEEMSRVFQRRTKQIRRFQMWQKAKYGILLGTAVTGVVAAVTVPPLVAIL